MSKLPWRKRYQDGGKRILLLAAVILGGSTVAPAAYFMASHYIWATEQASDEVRKANAERDELLEVLMGRAVMHEPGAHYGMVAELRWHVVKEAE